MILRSIEICAGAGGQALGLERAGFEHSCLVEIDSDACATLRLNRPHWKVVEGDVHNFSATQFRGIDLLAGGVPCPPFSKAGKQLGANDERDLFPEAIRLTSECLPRAVMLENVRGLLDSVFSEYRQDIIKQFKLLGYAGSWHLLNASDFGVPQLRPRAIFVAIRIDVPANFAWPEPSYTSAPTVGDVLSDLMATNGWLGVEQWQKAANDIAPTLVGGSKKHGGPDLGPTRSKKAWANLGVNGHGIADDAPSQEFIGMPKLTTRMAARIQGFPDEWSFSGKKTTAYRQIGNAFPPPVAQAVGSKIREALELADNPDLRRAYQDGIQTVFEAANRSKKEASTVLLG